MLKNEPNNPGPKTRILVVDDDPDFQLQLRLPLESAGYEVLCANGQAEAEKLLEQTWPALAIVDLMMEHLDSGFTLCHHIKKKSPGTPVILVTAVTRETGYQFDTNTPQERAWMNADIVLDKPVRFEQLRGEVKRLLRQAAAGTQ